LPADQLARFLGDLEEIRCIAMARLTAPPTMRAESDQLLSVEEASSRLGVSKDYLYRHREEFTFTRRMGRKLLFSSSGIERHIGQQNSLTAKRQGANIFSPVKYGARGN
jgi:excisionase family DNA binding protein